ncbi:MAG: general secretion pathway protein GspK, partial [Planctomycetaceae bacterium]|nr:general secretion pathway protein GspK [Planctomycetaceae bacterium]
RDRMDNDRDEQESWDNNPRLFQEQSLAPPPRDEAVQDDPWAWRFSIVSPNRSVESALAESSNVRFGLENESARLHLAVLQKLDAVSPERSREVLMMFPGMTESTADAILDWLDADDEPREFGAERQDYLELSGAIQPRNGIPATWEELLLVRDVRHSLLFGPDADRNFLIDAHETASQQQDLDERSSVDVDPDVQDLGWADLLTLWSAERNVDSLGRPRIDLNQTNESQLREQLSSIVPADVVEFILHYRRFGPVGRPTGALLVGGATRARMASVADLIDATVHVTDGSAMRLVQSPITSSSTELLGELFDRTTTEASPVIPGRININLALRPVLHAVPGFDDEIVEQILGRRTSLDPQVLKSPAWLLSEQILTLDQFRQALPHITTGGNVFRAQLIAWRPAGGPYRRVEVVIDGAQTPARRIAWNDLSAFGAAISPAQLSSLGVRGGGPTQERFR